MWLPSFPNAIYWKDSLYPIVYSWLLCHKLINHVCRGLFLGCLFCSVCLFVPILYCFIFLGSKITVDGDCSHEIKRCLFLGRRAMTNLDSVFKSRDIILPTKFYRTKAMVFPVVIYTCENWTIKKAECHRIDAFKLWCWRALLRVLWITRRSNQSILKKINPEYLLEGLMLKLKLQYISQLIQTADSLEKALMLGKIESRRRGWQRMKWLDGITDSMDTSLSKLQKTVEDRGAWYTAVHRASLELDIT